VTAPFTAPAGRITELRERLGARVEAYLVEHPSTVDLAPEEVEKRHAECCGNQLTVLDAEPGLAPDNTFRVVRWPRSDVLHDLP
jgi:hypothetical protein